MATRQSDTAVADRRADHRRQLWSSCSLGLFAWLAELRDGPSLVTAALDPARAGSLPDLWGQLQLAAVAALLWSRRATVPAACARWRSCRSPCWSADAADAERKPRPFAGCFDADPTKPPLQSWSRERFSDGVALVPALALWRRSCLELRRLGRWLACTLVVAGVPSLTLDWLGGSGGHRVATVEETVELILDSADSRSAARLRSPRSSFSGTSWRDVRLRLADLALVQPRSSASSARK